MRVETWWLTLRQADRQVILLAWAYFAYQAAAQFLAPYIVFGSATLPADIEGAVLRDARHLAFSSLQVGMLFTLAAYMQPKVLPWLCAPLLVAQTVFISLPSPFHIGAEFLLLAAVPWALLAAANLVLLRSRRRPEGAP